MKHPLRRLAGILAAIVAAPVLYAAGADHPSAQSQVQKVSLDVEGMKSRLDAEKIQKELKGRMGTISTRCDHVGGKCNVEIDPTKVRKEDVAVQMNRLGFHAFLRE